MIFKFDPGHGTLVPSQPPFAQVKPGAGPRHIAFHPNGRWAFVINEMGSTLTVFACDASAGALREVQTISTLPPGFPARTPARKWRRTRPGNLSMPPTGATTASRYLAATRKAGG